MLHGVEAGGIFDRHSGLIKKLNLSVVAQRVIRHYFDFRLGKGISVN